MELRATAEFEGGNAHVIDVRKGDEDVVTFAAQHKRGGPQALWFYIRIEGAHRKLRCVLVNPSQILGGASDWRQNAPVYRVDGGPWLRLRHIEMDNDEHLVPQVVFTFDLPPDGTHVVEVAACYPYLERDLEQTLSFEEVRRQWSLATIGVTAEGRGVKRLYNQLGDEARTMPGVYLIARQHSGETPGSWLLDGVVRYLSTPEGQQISRNMCVWAVPFADPDGVADGSYGKDQTPWDLNRAWGSPRRPEINAIQRDVHRWARRCRPQAIVDLHAPGYSERGFYFWAPTQPAAIAKITHQIAYRLRERVPTPLRGSEPAFRQWGTTRTSVQDGANCIKYGMETLGIPTASLEISYHGPDASTFYTEDDYRLLGEALIQSVYDIVLEQT